MSFLSTVWWIFFYQCLMLRIQDSTIIMLLLEAMLMYSAINDSVIMEQNGKPANLKVLRFSTTVHPKGPCTNAVPEDMGG